jgi:hypothetical protein
MRELGWLVYVCFKGCCAGLIIPSHQKWLEEWLEVAGTSDNRRDDCAIQPRALSEPSADAYDLRCADEVEAIEKLSRQGTR